MSALGTCPYGHDMRPNLRGWANRLILSHLNNGWDVPDTISVEINNCPGCWQGIAVYCANLASEHLVETIGSGQTLIDEDNIEAWEEVEEAARVTIEDRIARDLDFGVTE